MFERETVRVLNDANDNRKYPKLADAEKWLLIVWHTLERKGNYIHSIIIISLSLLYIVSKGVVESKKCIKITFCSSKNHQLWMEKTLLAFTPTKFWFGAGGEV